MQKVDHPPSHTLILQKKKKKKRKRKQKKQKQKKQQQQKKQEEEESHKPIRCRFVKIMQKANQKEDNAVIHIHPVRDGVTLRRRQHHTDTRAAQSYACPLGFEEALSSMCDTMELV